MLAFKKDGKTLFGINPDKIVDVSPFLRSRNNTLYYDITIYCTIDAGYTVKFKKEDEATAFMDNVILRCNFTPSNYIVDIGNGEV